MQPKLSNFSSKLFIGFFIYLILEGILRKWVAPSLGQPLFLFKYAILLLLYFRVFFLENKAFILPASYKGLFSIYFAYGLLSFFNFSVSANPIVQIFGLINNFIYVPLVPIFAYYMSTVEDLDKFITGVTWVCIPIFLLGVSQYYSPQHSFVNKYAVDGELGSYDVAVSGAGGRVRITGVFSYLAVYCVFLHGALLLIFCSIINQITLKKYDLVKIGTFAFGVINLFMTGSRGAVLMLGLTIAIYLLGLASTGKSSFISSLIPIAFFGMIAMSVVSNTEVGTESFGNFSERLQNTNDAGGRLDRLFSPFMNIDVAGAFGFGIGTTYQGTQQYITDRGLLPTYYEEEGDRLVLELGLIGYILVMTMRIGIVVYNYKMFQKIKDIDLKAISLLVLIFQLPPVVGFSNMEFSFMDGITFWAYGGIQLAVASIYQNRIKAKMAITSPYGMPTYN